MKTKLTSYDFGWEIALEPENAMEKCALLWLAGLPKDQVIVQITQLGVFSRKEDE